VRCIITAGPTYEPLDQVRRLTNFSTGRLGSALAAFLAKRGHEVTLLLGEQATYRDPGVAHLAETFTTTADLRERLKNHVSAAAVFHAAAVSDFTFGQVWVRSPQGDLTPIKAGKISTRQGTLMAELLPTQKIISELRSWYPAATIVGWKYEVDGDRASVLALAQRQILECHTNACVANGPAYGPGFGLVRKGEECVSLPDEPALFESLAGMIR
jgi:phosphopantothenate---cysteine ligase (CTP)